jgi:hypothetical protein
MSEAGPFIAPWMLRQFTLSTLHSVLQQLRAHGMTTKTPSDLPSGIDRTELLLREMRTTGTQCAVWFTKETEIEFRKGSINAVPVYVSIDAIRVSDPLRSRMLLECTQLVLNKMHEFALVTATWDGIPGSPIYVPSYSG